MSIKNINLGLCCINTTLRAQKPTITCNRTCRQNTAEIKGIEYIKELVLSNLRDVITILEWNYKNGIKSYRLSSDMFPHLSNPSFGCMPVDKPRYDIEFAREALRLIGLTAKKYDIRLSFHPGQYNQIASKSQHVFDKTCLDLYCHALILDYIEEGICFGDKSAIICIHGGGIYGDKEKTIQKWIERFPMLPENVRNRIALENCEKCYSSEDCLRISELVGVPHIFDIHHYNCYTLLHPDEKQKSEQELMPLIIKTWQKVGKKPYFHISEQGNGRIGHHSDFIKEIPEYMFNLGVDVTLDVEAKAKEKAILKLVYKYNGYDVSAFFDKFENKDCE